MCIDTPCYRPVCWCLFFDVFPDDGETTAQEGSRMPSFDTALQLPTTGIMILPARLNLSSICLVSSSPTTTRPRTCAHEFRRPCDPPLTARLPCSLVLPRPLLPVVVACLLKKKKRDWTTPKWENQPPNNNKIGKKTKINKQLVQLDGEKRRYEGEDEYVSALCA